MGREEISRVAHKGGSQQIHRVVNEGGGWSENPQRRRREVRRVAAVVPLRNEGTVQRHTTLDLSSPAGPAPVQVSTPVDAEDAGVGGPAHGVGAGVAAQHGCSPRQRGVEAHSGAFPQGSQFNLVPGRYLAWWG